ncbi:hypothetical protein [Streptomyces cavernae]|uniref:hypothetical protein n=1 Tax=Streptomyces cavernae TaxID=2259034 RepID=UPI000FEC108B|nr:hypothetical protein [Streptomyces cavernae]
MTPWTNGIQSFVAAAVKPESGNSALIGLRHIPGMVSIMTAALACTSSGNWANLKSLVVDPSVRDRYEQRPAPVLDMTDPYQPFGSTDLTANALARATTGRDLGDSLKDFTERNNGRYHTPIAEWLHHLLRPIFSDQLPDDDTYSRSSTGPRQCSGCSRKT